MTPVDYVVNGWTLSPVIAELGVRVLIPPAAVQRGGEIDVVLETGSAGGKVPAMNIVVCVKQAPDTAVERTLRPGDGTLDRETPYGLINEEAGKRKGS